jgi:enolase
VTLLFGRFVEGFRGFAPNVSGTREALELILEAIERAGYKPGAQISLALDCAASEFHHEDDEGKSYHLEGEGKRFSRTEFCGYLADLVGDYPIVSIEDGMARTTGPAGAY